MQASLFGRHIDPPDGPQARHIEAAEWDAYQRWSGMRASQFKWLADCLQVFQYYIANPFKPTQNMLEGTVGHTMLLEPDKLSSQIAIRDDWVDASGAPLSTSSDAYLARATAAKAQGLIIVSQATVDRLQGAVDTVRAFRIDHEAYPELHQWDCLGDLIDGSLREHSAHWIHERTGIHCKARADIWTPTISTVLDLKFAGKSAAPYKFAAHARDLLYPEAAAHYLEGFLADRWFWIAVHPEPPYTVGLYRAPDVWLAAARQRREQFCDDYLRAMGGANEGYPQGDLLLPAGFDRDLPEMEIEDDTGAAIDEFEVALG